ncbi:MAG: hypothetical protein HJJLKODD_01210 [Phycisphaerae bacterium]|nr:hypothetical protein [Phycisphaerae bacterium]
MSKHYRRSSQHGLLWVIIVIIGIGCGLAGGSTLPKSVQWWWAVIVVIVPMFVAIALCVSLTGRMKRRRVGNIQADLERDGFIMDPQPDAERKNAVLAPVADLQRRLELRNGSAGIEWVALHTRQPSAVCIFEHSYITGSGKTTQEHQHTVMAWLVPQMTMGGVSVFRPHWLQRRVLTQNTTMVKLGDEAFDKQWVVLGDEASAKQFFTSSMRLILADSPKGESWHLGTGWMACAFDGAMDTHNLALFRSRCAEIVAHSGLSVWT